MRWIDLVEQTVRKYPDDLAVTCHGEALTYAQLWDKAGEEMQRMREVGTVGEGELYRLPCTQDADYVVRFVALHRLGVRCDILFTTGSTGKPKGVLMCDEGLIANGENLILSQGFHHGLRFVICGPLDHFGSWSKMLPVLMTGGTLVVMEGMKQMEAVLDALGEKAPSATFMVPSALKMLMMTSRERLSALTDRIEFIEAGGAPLTTSDMETLRQLLPHTRLYNTYASTETGIVSTYAYHNFGEEGSQELVPGCVGRMMKHAEVTLTPEGRIVVSGPMVMESYLVTDEEGRLSLPLQDEVSLPVRDNALLVTSQAGHPMAATRTFETSDLGQIDPQGRLILTGRVSDIINVGGLKLSPLEVEEAAQRHPDIADCLCVPVAHRMMGQVPKLLVVLTPGATLDKKKLALYLKSQLDETWKVPMQYEAVDEIPKTANGKKRRTHL